MATIQSSLQLHDAMTKPLRNITNALNLTISTMQHMQSVTNQNVHVDRALLAAKKEIAAAETQIKSSIEAAQASQRRFNDTMRTGQGHANRLASTIKGISAIYLAFQGAKQLFKVTIGAAFEQQKMEDMFVARTGNQAVGEAMFAKFKQDALRAGMDVEESLKGALSFFSATQNTGQLSELNRLTQQLAAFDSAGNGIEGAAFAIKEAMSGDIVSLAERFNMSKSDIRQFQIDKLGKSGNIEAFTRAFDKLLDKQRMGKKAFEKMLESPVKQAEILGNHIKSMFAGAGEGAMSALLPLIKLLNQAFQTGKFQSFFSFLQTGLTLLAYALSGLVQGALWLWEVIATYWPEITAMLITWAAIYLPGVIAKLWAMVPPVLSHAAAWLLVNWPILLVIAAVGILIWVLRQFGVTTDQMIGFVVGLFYMLGAVIHNVIGFAWNIFVSFAEFLNNIFRDPIYAIKKLFYDLAMEFWDITLNMIRSVENFSSTFTKLILKAVNKVLESFNWLMDKVNNLLGADFGKAELFDENNVHAMSDRMKNMIDQIQKPTSSKHVVDVSMYKMKQQNVGDAFHTGYHKGSGFMNQVGNMLNVDSLLGKWNAGAGKNTVSSMDEVGKVGKVGKIEDTVDISSEDIKLMREVAEMKNIQNFVTLTPTVQVTTGDIRNGNDEKTLVAHIKQIMEEELVTSAQGVYGI